MFCSSPTYGFRLRGNHECGNSGGELGTLTSDTNTGTFTNQAEVFEATFSLSSASQLTIFTTSYGGGSNLSGLDQPPADFNR